MYQKHYNIIKGTTLPDQITKGTTIAQITQKIHFFVFW